jgi:hypothetical protein
MALTAFQRDVCRLVADIRIHSGESYVAGGVALNEILGASRVSRDIDLFHDSVAALDAAWQADRAALRAAGYDVEVLRERTGLVEARVARRGDGVLVQWSHDSAYRFFPLVLHDELGLTLHPFDLATNKILALVGRSEPRDFVDAVACHAGIQRLGYLAWAACGKDPGFSPDAILEHAARSSRYAPAEFAGLAFEGPPPDPAELSRRWHTALGEARRILPLLPAHEAGRAVLSRGLDLYRGTPDELEQGLTRGEVVFHEGAIRGALPLILG